jgi:predicted DNA-binding transcriptional regulator YafY
MARMEIIFKAIKSQRRPNCSSLAEKLEVSAKTVQRDIDYMRYQLKLPIEYDKEQHGFYFTEHVTHFPSVHITESELVALLVARKAVEQYANTPFQKPLTEAFQKLTAGFGVNEALLDSIGVFVGTPPEEIVLRFSGWAATVAAERTWHSSQSIRNRDDETVELKLKVVVNPEFERRLWSWGDAVEIVSPATLRDKIRAAYQRAAVRNR